MIKKKIPGQFISQIGVFNKDIPIQENEYDTKYFKYFSYLMITDFNHKKKEKYFFDFQEIIDDKLISKKEIEILQNTYLNK